MWLLKALPSNRGAKEQHTALVKEWQKGWSEDVLSVYRVGKKTGTQDRGWI